MVSNMSKFSVWIGKQFLDNILRYVKFRGGQPMVAMLSHKVTRAAARDKNRSEICVRVAGGTTDYVQMLIENNN